MFVLILSFVFSNVIVKCQTNDTMLKTHLQESLLHVNAMLADIEGKIETERKLIARLDSDLNYKDKASFLDYEITDIWWHTTTNRIATQTTSTTSTPESAKKVTRSMLNTQIRLRQQNKQNVFSKTNSTLLRGNPKPPAISDIVSTWVQNNANPPIRTSGTQWTLGVNSTNETLKEPPAPVKTIPTTNLTIATTLTTTVTTSQRTEPRPNITPNTYARTVPPKPARDTGVTFPPGVPAGWPFVVTTVSVAPTTSQNSSFVKDLKNVMAQDQHGYFSAFLTKFLLIVYTKDDSDLNPVFQEIEHAVDIMIKEGKLNSLGQDITDSLYLLMAMRSLATMDILKHHAEITHNAIKHKHFLVPKDINALIDKCDAMFTQEDGEKLFASLERFENFHEDKSGLEVAQGMLDAMLAPYLRLSPKDHRQFRFDLHQVLQELYPHWRAQDEQFNATVLRTYSAIHKLSNDSKDKNLLSVIPSRRRMALPSYKKIMRHLIKKHPKLFKKYYRHYKQNKESTHHHTAHKKHRHVTHKNHRTQKKVLRAYAPILKKPTSHRILHTRTYQDSCGSGAYYHERFHKVKRFMERRKYKKRVHNRTIIPSKLNSINAEYIRKQIAKHLRTKIKKKSFRKFMIDSSENEKEKHSQNLQNDVDKNVVHKIREASSYSDEEDDLKSNLYDALRHSNRSFVEFRALDTDTTDNPIGIAWDSSSDPDDEWVLKNNIYKVFQQ